MGYTTDFNGSFQLNQPLTSEHRTYLKAFTTTRRMKRDADKAEALPDLVRLAVGLPIGPEGAYFVGGGGMCGQDRDESILDYNHEPEGQPGLWCQWGPGTENDITIEWDQGDKFYDYTAWIKYLIDHFLKPWGYTLSGEVRWRGEDWEDSGVIVVAENVVTTR